MRPKWIACGWYVIGKERREFWETFNRMVDAEARYEEVVAEVLEKDGHGHVWWGEGPRTFIGWWIIKWKVGRSEVRGV